MTVRGTVATLGQPKVLGEHPGKMSRAANPKNPHPTPLRGATFSQKWEKEETSFDSTSIT
jgi:hypothetical protein